MSQDAIDLKGSPDRQSRQREPLPVVRMLGVALLLALAVGFFSLTILNSDLGALGGAASAALAVVLLGLAGALGWSLVEASGDSPPAQAGAPGRLGFAAEHTGALVGQTSSPGGVKRGADDLMEFFDGNPLGLAELDTAGRFVFVNEVLAGWLGREAAELVANGENLGDFTSQILPGGLHAIVGDVELRNAGGEAFPAHISRRDIPAGKGGGVRLAVRELTGERELEETLRRAEEGFRRFFDYAPVGIVMVDGGGVAVETNAAFNLMTKPAGNAAEVRKEAEVADAAFIDLIEASDRDRVAARLKAARRGDHGDAPLEVRLTGHEERTVQLYARRAGAGENAVSNEAADLIVYIVDTTELKNLETQVAQSQKMQAVGQLAGGIAHDFNNLLTAMIGYSDLLLQRYSPGDQSFADIMQIKQNANRAANLVRQLLAFSRRQTLQPRVLNLTDVLAELSHLLRRLIGENIKLDIVHARDVGLVRVDQGQLEQVIINLAVNARDAMTEGGTLSIRSGNVTFAAPTATAQETIPAGDYVLIQVKDTGAGIAPGDLAKVFEPFFTTKDVGAGTGLGLSTVYGIIKQTGGFIVPQSRPGEGAAFSIYLPKYDAAAAEDREAEPEAEEAAPADLTGVATILLVEDEDPVRLFAVRALENKGYTVLPADCAEAAMEIVEDYDGVIDLAVTDVVMPQMDGPTFITWLVERRPEVKVIYISGYAEDAFRNSIADDRPYDFLPKPFSLKELARAVKDVMDRE